MQSRFFLNIVVREGATVLELLSSEDQALLVRGDAFLVLDLGLDIVNSIRRLYFLPKLVSEVLQSRSKQYYT